MHATCPAIAGLRQSELIILRLSEDPGTSWKTFWNVLVRFAISAKSTDPCLIELGTINQ